MVKVFSRFSLCVLCVTMFLYSRGCRRVDGNRVTVRQGMHHAAWGEHIDHSGIPISNRRAISFLPKFGGAPRTRLPQAAGERAKRRVLIVG